MSTALLPPPAALRLPDHNDLPETDGSIVINFNEAPQTRLLTEAIEPVLRELHPDGHYAIGQDSGIYFRLTDPPLDGCRAPDWFYVPDVPPMAPGGESRRSYVMWQEIIAPLISSSWGLSPAALLPQVPTGLDCYLSKRLATNEVNSLRPIKNRPRTSEATIMNGTAAVEPKAMRSASPAATVPTQTSTPAGKNLLIVNHGLDSKVITT